MTNEHSHPVPSYIRDDSICESSLPPNKSSGDIGELKPCPFCGPGNSVVECYQDDYGGWRVGCGRCGSHSGFRPKSDPEARAKVIANWNKRPAESAAEIERLRREVENLILRNSNLEEQRDSHAARALTAESAVAAAWEEAAKIAEGEDILTHDPYEHAVAIAFGIRSRASAIRAAGSKKTAESGHSA